MREKGKARHREPTREEDHAGSGGNLSMWNSGPPSSKARDMGLSLHRSSQAEGIWGRRRRESGFLAQSLQARRTAVEAEQLQEPKRCVRKHWRRGRTVGEAENLPESKRPQRKQRRQAQRAGGPWWLSSRPRRGRRPSSLVTTHGKRSSCRAQFIV